MSADDASAPIELQLPPEAWTLASGIGFTEGPTRMDGDSIAVVSVNRGHVYRVPMDGTGATLLADVGGGPNGMALGSDGSLWVAQNGATAMPSRSTVRAVPSIQRLIGAQVETFGVGEVTAPSDCALDHRGRLWFTDPTHRKADGITVPGALRVLDTQSGRVSTAAEGLVFPNGIAFGPGADSVYVSETARSVVRRFTTGREVRADGWVADLRGARPDGIALDEAGWLWVSTGARGSVMAFDTAGELREEIHFGDRVLATSVAFAGEEHDVLVVTIAKGGTVAALPARHPGLPVGAHLA